MKKLVRLGIGLELVLAGIGLLYMAECEKSKPVINLITKTVRQPVKSEKPEASCLPENSALPTATPKGFIKWVDFNVTYEALNQSYKLDKESHEEEVQLDWVALLAYAGTKCGGNFSDSSKIQKYIAEAAEQFKRKQINVEKLSEKLKYYAYYYEAYSAVLGGIVGEFEIQTLSEDTSELVWEKRYGIKGFSPIAKNFGYSEFDDFGVSRSYGYQRRHLGHDMMGLVGTPVIAVESGYIEALGWNQYGGWRIGIRSFDGKRYYYYAHLRKDFPYCKTLKEGCIVQAGDVIGYLGRTGYSTKENVNNINTSHLHFGLQLIFDESQKEGNNEIWVNVYPIVRFLAQNRSEAVKDETTKEWVRVYDIRDPVAEKMKKKNKEG